jgi:ubiquinone/menaquinone biosynthesis C-methylase UbiE
MRLSESEAPSYIFRRLRLSGPCLPHREGNMDTWHYRSKSKFLTLGEEQNLAFDREFHSREELESKFMLLEEWMNDKPFNLLDLGGGNGIFADQLLARFPKISVTILDISALLLAKNRPCDRKELIHDSIENMGSIMAGRTFDCITLNWVLHHLTGKSYEACRQNCIDTLIRCKAILKPNGKVLVAENMFEGYLKSNLPSFIIYTITATKWPRFVRLAKRFFNTAGVGVCFQSQRAWQNMFAQAGFRVASFQRGLVWWWLSSFPGILIHLLFIRSVSHGHFFLEVEE